MCTRQPNCAHWMQGEPLISNLGKIFLNKWYPNINNIRTGIIVYVVTLKRRPILIFASSIFVRSNLAGPVRIMSGQ